MKFSTLGLCTTAALSRCASAAGAAVPIFLFTKFPTSSQEYRDELIGRMDNISHWSCANEPGVKKYAVFVPRNEQDTLTAYSIQQYDDGDTLNALLAAPIVQEGLFSWTTSTPHLWSTPPEVQNFTNLGESTSYSKSQILEMEDPYVVVEQLTVEYEPSTAATETLETIWQSEVESTRNEGVPLYGVYGNPEDENHFYILGIYEDEEAYSLHGSSETGMPLFERLARSGFGLSVEIVGLKKRGGFLYRDGTNCG